MGDGKEGTEAGTISAQATLDQRGRTVEMYTVPTISIASPFHISSAGYGLFFDTTWPGTYDLGDTEPAVEDVAFEGPALKMFFTYGPSMPDIIRRHTDWVGKVEDNMRLSQARGEAVVAELVNAYGIQASRLKGYGVGPLAPVAGNDDEAGRAKNRRVDLVKAN